MTLAIKINANDGVKRNVMTGGETEVDFDFPIFDATHIQIYETNAAGVISLLVKDVDYTVPAGSVNQQAGGTVDLVPGVYPSGATATHVFTAYQAAPEARITDFNQAGDYLADTLNQELDLLAQQNQQIRRDLNRALLAPVDTTISSFSLPAPVDGAVLQWDGVAGAVTNGPSGSEISAAAGNATAAAASAAAAATSETNAGTSATNAAASEAAAASSAAEGLYNDVVSKVFADSPIVPILSEEGTLFRCDTSGGSIVINLSALSSYAEDMKFAFVKTTGDANTITINRGGTDTIDAGTSVVIADQFVVNVLVGDSATGSWVKVVHSASVSDGSITNAKLDDMAQATIKGRASGAGTGVPVDLTAAQVREILGSGLPTGYKYGGILSNGTDADHDIDVAAGAFRDSADAENITLSAITKQLDATWAAGDDAGGRSSSVSLAVDTWFHVFAIIVGGSADVGFDTSITAANLVTDHSATAYRYLGSVLTDGSSNIIAFEQNGNRFDWVSPTLDVSASDSATASTRTVKVPTGLIVEAHISVNASGGGDLYVSSLAQADLAPSGTAAPLSSTSDNLANRGVNPQAIVTNTSGQLRTRSTGSQTVRIVTNGWAIREWL